MFLVTGFPLAAFVAGSATLALCADVKLALRRSNIDIKEAAADLCTRVPKLSAQLSGKEPFTLFWRFAVLGERFQRELNAIRAERYGQQVVTPDIGALIATLDTIHKRMARMELAETQKEKRA